MPRPKKQPETRQTEITMRNGMQEFNLVTELDPKEVANEFYRKFNLVGTYECETNKGLKFRVG